MKEIVLDVKNLKKYPETDEIISGELISKSKIIGSFVKENNIFLLNLNEKSPYSLNDLDVFAKQIKYVEDGNINDLIKYLIVLKEWKKKIPTYIRRGWKYFYLLSGKKEQGKVIITYASRKDNPINNQIFLEENCLKNGICNYNNEVLTITNPDEIENYKKFIFQC